VWLGGVRVPFTVAADSVTFPDGAELGPGCESGSGGAGGAGGTGGGVAAGGSAGSAAGAVGLIPASSSDEEGCGCRLARGQDRTRAVFALVMLGVPAAMCGWRRQRARPRNPTINPKSMLTPAHDTALSGRDARTARPRRGTAYCAT
jgi:hypothetical protein